MAPMRPLTLVLIVHDHQPVGNFDDVFARACDRAYTPFLSFLERHPRLRLALHTSGPLIEWIGRHRRDYLHRLRALVARGQVEPWGGGFYEPVLPAIPGPDRRGQILAMSDWLEEELGQRPRGLWLTERVWEPGLASTLAGAGIEYTAVDDAHFFAAGFERDALWGCYHTEDQGLPLRVFPIHRELRYHVPFQPPERTVALLRAVAQGGEGRLAVLGDDGEKFGEWPGTHALCYEQGWLERFAAALEAEPWITVRTPAEALGQHRPLGLAYLPGASYHELQAWALPPAAQRRTQEAAEILAPRFGDRARDLLRGGEWRNFLVRYPEANRLHKRMLRASRRLWAAPEPEAPAWREARTHLWRAQCNCAYWHGVFGGLYLPHLRSALYRELIAVEAWLGGAGTRVEVQDFDLDGATDALLETRAWSAWVGARGGALWAFDDRIARWNYGDTLARRAEAYHAALRDAAVGGGAGATIHAAPRLKEPGLAALIPRDDEGPRDSFLSRWNERERAHDWGRERFDLATGAAGEVMLQCAEGEAPAIGRRFRADASGALEVETTLRSARARSGRLELLLHLGLHVPEAEDRYVEIEGARATPSHFAAGARHQDVTRAAFVDLYDDRRLEVRSDRPAALERAPIETVSLSEAGAERVFQGIALRYRFEATLAADVPWAVRFVLAPGRAGARP